MHFWIYFKGNNNGQLLVGYRYTPESDIKSLTFSNYQSCLTNTTKCSWQRIDVSLTHILTQRTEVNNTEKKIFFLNIYVFYFI